MWTGKHYNLINTQLFVICKMIVHCYFHYSLRYFEMLWNNHILSNVLYCNLSKWLTIVILNRKFWSDVINNILFLSLCWDCYNILTFKMYLEISKEDINRFYVVEIHLYVTWQLHSIEEFDIKSKIQMKENYKTHYLNFHVM